MVGDLPPNVDGGSTIQPPIPGQWPPTYPPQPTRRAHTWPAIALAAIAVLLGAAALIVALTRPVRGPAGSANTSVAPAYTAEETAAAHKRLCDVYKLAARAIEIETHGTSPERAGIATVNGAVLLEEALNAAPAVTSSDRAAAVALAEAYSNAASVASLGDNPAWQSAIDDVNAKDAAMKKVCGS